MAKLQPVIVKRLEVTIKGLTPIIHHKWSEKAKKGIRDTKAGNKAKDRKPCRPKKEADDCTWKTYGGKYGIPAGAIKGAILNAAHKDLGYDKTLVRKSLFIVCRDPLNVLEMDCGDPVMREDPVTVGGKSSDLRYRNQFIDWGVTFKVEYDSTLMTKDVFQVLLGRAGFGVGLLEWRPEKGKGGEFGRFEVVSIKDIE